MNIGGLLSSPYQTQIAGNRVQRQAQFQQLGEDLQSGNLSAARQDFASLTSLLSGATPSSTTTSPQSTVNQDFQKLGQDLQSGDLSAAQTDYTQIQQNAAKAHTAHGHHHHANTDATNSSTSTAGGLLSLLTNTATAAVSAYGSGGLTGLSAAGSLVSALV